MACAQRFAVTEPETRTPSAIERSELRDARAWLANQTARMGREKLGTRLESVLMSGGFGRGVATDIRAQSTRRMLDDAEILLMMDRRQPLPRGDALSSMCAALVAWLEREEIACRFRLRAVWKSES